PATTAIYTLSLHDALPIYRFGLVRWNGRTPGMGAELSLAANVYTQFDFNTASYDLINADYVVGLPITFRWNRFSARLRLYHQSRSEEHTSELQSRGHLVCR